MLRRRDFVSLLCAVAVAAGAAFAWGGTASAETTLERIKREGKIRVGIFNEVPAGFVTEDGKLAGESPDTLRVALQKIGDIEMEANVVDEFGALIPGLLAGRFDVIAAGLYFRPARCEQIAFTRPTVKYGEGMIVKKGNPLGVKGYEDVAKHGSAVVAVAAGGTQVALAEQAGIPKDRTMVVPNYPTALVALAQGRADAVGAPATVAQSIMAEDQTGQFELLQDFVDPVLEGKPAISFAGLGVRKADQDLLKALNDALDGFVNSEEHLKLVEPYGFGRAQMPGDVTAEQACAG